MKAKIVPATSTERQILGKILPLATPFTVEVYPSNVCNFKCIFCAQSSRPVDLTNEFMSMDTYRKLIEDCKAFPSRLKLLLFSGLGEPLLHPQIAEMVQIAKTANIAETVRIITNASLLSSDMSDKLISAGLDHLKISIQGLTDKKYKEMCGRTGLEQIISNIRYFYQHKKSTIVNIKIVAEAFEKSGDDQLFYSMFGDICDQINIEYIAAYQDTDYSSFDLRDFVSQTGINDVVNEICQLCFFFCSVYPDGTIIPCCVLSFDKYKQLSLGNVNDVSLSSIWTSKEYNRFRIMHLNREKNTHAFCKNCAAFFQSQCRPEDNLDEFADSLIGKYSINVEE